MLPRNHIRVSLVGMWLLLSEQVGAVSAVVAANRRYNLNCVVLAMVHPVSFGARFAIPSVHLRHVRKTRPVHLAVAQPRQQRGSAVTKKIEPIKEEPQEGPDGPAEPAVEDRDEAREAEEKAQRWKREANAQRTSATRAGARAERLQKKLDAAAGALEPTKATGPVEAAASGRPSGEPTTPDGVTLPDKSWTVVQLRAEARARA